MHEKTQIMHRRFLVNLYYFLPFICHLSFLNIPHRLWQCSCSPMQMIWMCCFMLMKYHAVPFFRIIRIMQIPIVSGISGLLRHIMLTQHNDVEILRINFLKLSCIKHFLPPLWQTMWPTPVPKLP